MALPFGKKTKEKEAEPVSAPVPQNPNAYTLASSPIKDTLALIRAEHARLSSLIERIEAIYAQHQQTDLVTDSSVRDAILTPIFQAQGEIEQTASAQFKSDIISLLQRLGPDVLSTSGHVSHLLERQEARRQQQQRAAEQAEQVRQAELAEINRISALFAKHNRPFPPAAT